MFLKLEVWIKKICLVEDYSRNIFVIFCRHSKNRYNRNPQPALNNKWERDTYEGQSKRSWTILITCKLFDAIWSNLQILYRDTSEILVFFCSSVPVVVFDTPGISRCRSQHVSVESSSLLHHSICL